MYTLSSPDPACKILLNRYCCCCFCCLNTFLEETYNVNRKGLETPLSYSKWFTIALRPHISPKIHLMLSFGLKLSPRLTESFVVPSFNMLSRCDWDTWSFGPYQLQPAPFLGMINLPYFLTRIIVWPASLSNNYFYFLIFFPLFLPY